MVVGRARRVCLRVCARRRIAELYGAARRHRLLLGPRHTAHGARVPPGHRHRRVVAVSQPPFGSPAAEAGAASPPIRSPPTGPARRGPTDETPGRGHVIGPPGHRKQQRSPTCLSSRIDTPVTPARPPSRRERRVLVRIPGPTTSVPVPVRRTGSAATGGPTTCPAAPAPGPRASPPAPPRADGGPLPDPGPPLPPTKSLPPRPSWA